MAGDVQNLLKLSLVQCSRGSSVIQLTLRQHNRQLHKVIFFWGWGGLSTYLIFIKKKTVDLNVLISDQTKTGVYLISNIFISYKSIFSGKDDSDYQRQIDFV